MYNKIHGQNILQKYEQFLTVKPLLTPENLHLMWKNK